MFCKGSYTIWENVSSSLPALVSAAVAARLFLAAPPDPCSPALPAGWRALPPGAAEWVVGAAPACLLAAADALRAPPEALDVVAASA